MFTAGKYKVVFKRVWHLYPGTSHRRGGRYDTQCTIFVDGSETTFHGLAKLHPNDQPDKVVGKKKAFSKAVQALLPFHYSRDCLEDVIKRKAERTLIWKAFWAWVESWKPINKEN